MVELYTLLVAVAPFGRLLRCLMLKSSVHPEINLNSVNQSTSNKGLLPKIMRSGSCMLTWHIFDIPVNVCCFGVSHVCPLNVLFQFLTFSCIFIIFLCINYGILIMLLKLWYSVALFVLKVPLNINNPCILSSS